MEIGLNKQEIIKTSEFVNFSIREYVAEIRKKDRKKCWPFGSLGDPEKYDVFVSYDQSIESSFLCSQNCPGDQIECSNVKPEDKETSNSSNKVIFNGKEDDSQTTVMIESLGIINDNMCKRVNNGSYPDSNSCKVINKADQNGPENSENGIGDNNIDEPGRKHQKLRLLSDILKNLNNVNTKFTTDTEEDELDDDFTLDAFSRKRKGVEESKFEKEEKSKCGSKNSPKKTRIDEMDFGTMAKRKKVIRSPKKNDTEPTEIANEDSEMEAVMLLATHFNEENPSISPKLVQSNIEVKSLEASKRTINTNSPLSSSSSGNRPAKSGLNQGSATGTTTCACVQKKIRSIPKFYTPNLSKTATKDPKVYLVCSINRNPADFSIPNTENVFMRGG